MPASARGPGPLPVSSTSSTACIGQGLHVIVLVTTNEENPASSLPQSRVRSCCAANVMFESLDRDEAVAWLAKRGVEAALLEATTLASLYAQAEGRDPSETVLLGFSG